VAGSGAASAGLSAGVRALRTSGCRSPFAPVPPAGGDTARPVGACLADALAVAGRGPPVTGR
jgi:hypothetical protein